MKIRALRDVKENLAEVVRESQGERIVLTRHGRPAAILIGVEGERLEDLLTANDPAFWEMIRARRQQPTVSLGQVRREIGLDRKPRPRRRARG